MPSKHNQGLERIPCTAEAYWNFSSTFLLLRPSSSRYIFFFFFPSPCWLETHVMPSYTCCSRFLSASSSLSDTFSRFITSWEHLEIERLPLSTKRNNTWLVAVPPVKSAPRSWQFLLDGNCGLISMKRKEGERRACVSRSVILSFSRFA